LVALTGYGQAEDRARARAAGFDVHATKPLDVDRLLEITSIVARAHRRSDR
jgi:CheY-like chemotaxis protein